VEGRDDEVPRLALFALSPVQAPLRPTSQEAHYTLANEGNYVFMTVWVFKTTMENTNTYVILESVTTWGVGELAQCIDLLHGTGEVISE